MKKKITALILTAALMLGTAFAVPVMRARAVTKAEIEDLKTQKSELGDQINELQSQIDELATQESETLEQKEAYDRQCALLSEQIVKTEEQIAGYEELIERAKVDLQTAKEAEKVQYERMCVRLRAMEENGVITYWEVLFDAKDFSDLLGRLDFILEIVNHDEDVIADYQRAQQETQKRANELNGLLKDAEDTKAELEKEKKDYEQKLEEANELILKLQDNQAEYQKLLDAVDAEEKAIQEQIEKKEAEYEAQIEEQRKRAEAAAAAAAGEPVSLDGLSLDWPCGSRQINSYFGYRSPEATNYVGSTNHGGIDIGGVGYSTPVLASADGVVTVATYSGSAGNYVVVSHGNGVSTCYMHMSSISVSEGQTVSRGDVLGISGSTGNSTGPHIHFGVSVYGTYVDPLAYLP